MLTIRELKKFEAGAIYKHNDTGEIVTFVGIALSQGEDGSDVGVFSFVDDGGVLLATERAYQRGESFTPIAEAIQDDLDSES